MPASASETAFARAIDAKFREFDVAFDQAIKAVSVFGNDANRRKPLSELYRVARTLYDYLAEEDRPKWLKDLLHGLANLNDTSQESSERAVRAIISSFSKIRPFDFARDDTDPLDLDAIYERCRDSGRLPELFDELIRLIRQMIESNAIDSITVLETLQQMLAILKKARNGSFIAAKEGLSLTRYFWHLACVVIEEIPVLKQAIEAYKRADNEAEAEFRKVEQAMRDEAITKVESVIPRLLALPEI